MEFTRRISATQMPLENQSKQNNIVNVNFRCAILLLVTDLITRRRVAIEDRNLFARDRQTGEQKEKGTGRIKGKKIKKGKKENRDEP